MIMMSQFFHMLHLLTTEKSLFHLHAFCKTYFEYYMFFGCDFLIVTASVLPRLKKISRSGSVIGFKINKYFNTKKKKLKTNDLHLLLFAKEMNDNKIH